MRKTKIICTIGPASDSEEMLEKLILAGMDVARFNFSHATHDEARARLKRLERVRTKLGRPVASLMDTKGPEIRLGNFESGQVKLTAGQTFILTGRKITGTSHAASITYPDLKNDISVGSAVLIDDGLIEMVVEAIEEDQIICRVINEGVVSDHKGINVPGADLSMPYISEADRADIVFGAQMGYDFIAASFTRTKEDILEVREILNAFDSRAKIIAKIENMQGIEHLEEILAVSDGIMIARGDMGVEIPLEEVPVLQKKMIRMAVEGGKQVITATQMLDSMIYRPRPTRAESTDVANAIYDGTTAIMLSGETAAGQYPVESVQTMDRIAQCAERNIDYRRNMIAMGIEYRNDTTTAIAMATCLAAMVLKARAIITVSMTGFTTNAVSRFKPSCRIIGCSLNEKISRQNNLLWGVVPIVINEESDMEELFSHAVDESKKAGLISHGDIVVITAGMPLGVEGSTNMVRVAEVE